MGRGENGHGESSPAAAERGHGDDRLVSQAATRELFEPSDADDSLEPLLEALLLASEGPASLAELAVVAGVATRQIEEVLEKMGERPDRGWIVVRHGSQAQIATSARFSSYVRHFLGMEREAKLSPAALETLAIIAYEQPVTRSAIEAIRGVDCTAVLTTLLTRNVVQATGRLDVAGQPFEYRTTPDFLRYFGLRSLEDLPPLGVVEGISIGEVLASSIEETEQEEPGLELVGSVIEASSPASEVANS